MSHRTEVSLSDDQFARLCEESRQTGLSLSELVGRAIERAYDQPLTDAAREALLEDRLEALERSFGAWSDRDFDGEEYVERLRRGMTHRLAKVQRPY